MPEVLAILTCKQRSELLESGGTGWWKLDAARARRVGKVVILHNANDPRSPGEPERHGKPFLLATVRGVHTADDGRCLIQFDAYADIRRSGFEWPGYRNPTKYLDDDEVLGHLELGEWQHMPEVSFEEALAARLAWDKRHSTGPGGGGSAKRDTKSGVARSVGQVIAEHREAIADELGVSPESIRIMIEV